MTSIFSQHPHRCRLDWGRHGARQAAERGDVLVIVDTISFSTAVATAVHHGGVIYPCSWGDDTAALARRTGGEVAVGRHEVPEKGRFSLSPLTYRNLEPGTRIILPSPNGAACCRSGSRTAVAVRQAPHLFVGALVNAKAVAAAVSEVLDTTDLCATVIACGERWRESTEDGELRVAFEDALGAGAILSYLQHEKSPEARACEGSFLHLRGDLEAAVFDCASGRELRERGYGEDVLHAAQLNAYDAVAVMRGESLVRLD